jgi:hypothetical protein
LRVPTVLLEDLSVADPVLRAMTLGVVDTYRHTTAGTRDSTWL